MLKNIIMNSSTTTTTTQTGNGDSNWSKVVLLLNGDDLLDKSSSPKTVTASGNAQVSTTQSKFGGKSIYFDGNGDRLSLASSTDFKMDSNDFTIECWTFLTAFSGTVFEFGRYTDGILLRPWNSDDFYINGSNKGNVAQFLTLNTWNHIAIVKNGSTVVLYINGNSKVTVTGVGNITVNFNDLSIGSSVHNGSPDQFLTGYIDDFRITKGLARYTANFTPPAAALPTSAESSTASAVVIPDSSKYVSLLLNGDGVNAAQNNTFIDSSTNNATITRYGDVAQGSFGPFGNSWSNYFDGTGDYLTGSITGGLSSGDFTAECWINVSSVSASDSSIFDIRSGTTTDGFTFDLTGTTNSYMSIFTNARIITSNALLQKNKWTHFALVRSGTTFTLYQDGVNVGTASASGYNMTNSSYFIGKGYWAGSESTGYISNLRIVKGTALYTSNFTPSTTPLTAVSGTTLLTCNSNRFKDDSTSNATITPYGDVKVVKNSPFPEIYDKSVQGASAYFDGTGDYLTVPSNTNFDFGTGDFTIECWINPSIFTSSPNNYIPILDSRNAANTTSYCCGIWNGKLDLFFGNGARLTSTNSLVRLNSWNHIVATRSSGTVRLFVNGVLDVSTTGVNNSFTPSGTNILIGKLNDGDYNTGYISNLRIIKGSALYTTNFTPSTTPLSAVANTSVLLKCDNAGIVDATGKNDLVTYGNAQISTTTKKYGTGSMYFDGTGDYLTIPNNQNFVLSTTDFTIEAWVNPSTGGTWKSIVACRSGVVSTTGEWVFGVHDTGYLYFYTDNHKFASTYTIANSTWSHVAISRNGTNLMLFVNGVLKQTVTNSQNFTFGSCSIGSNYNNTELFTGYIDDLRITKGKALYTANFTPPTEALAIGNYVVSALPANDPNTSKYVSLLLNGEGTNGAQNNLFVDSSSNNATITRYGDVTQGSFGPFGNSWSNYFDGTGDYLSFANSVSLTLTGGDYTIESWVYPQSRTDYGVIIAKRGATGREFQLWLNITDGSLSCSSSAGTNYNSTQIVPLNTWSHIAAVYTHSNTTMKLYFNGSLVHTINNFDNSQTKNENILVGTATTTSQFFNGNISNLRIVKGTALYNSNFTPSITPLTAVSGTVLLTCNSNRFIDTSMNKATITVNGDTKVVKDSPFPEIYDKSIHGASAYFDGTGDYLQTPVSTTTDLRGSSFTIECWVYKTSNTPSDGGCIVINRKMNGGAVRDIPWALTISNGAYSTANTVYIGTGSTSVGSSTVTITNNTWVHIAASMTDSGALYLFINGVLVGSNLNFGLISTTNFDNNTVQVGYGAFNTQYFPGYISNLRIIKGQALYTSNFTPSTTPLSTVANTSLLLKCDNVGIVDATGKNDLVTYGNAQISTTTKKYGTGSMYFDGTGDYLVLPNSTCSNFGVGDFTIEMWINPISMNAAGNIFFDQRPNVDGPYICLYTYTSSTIRLWVNGSDVIVGGSLSVNTWYHIAVVRSSGITKLYLNGTQTGSSYTDTNNYVSPVNRPVIGIRGVDLTNNPWNGYIDDLRITKGKALYTANFTPPTQSLTL